MKRFWNDIKYADWHVNPLSIILHFAVGCHPGMGSHMVVAVQSTSQYLLNWMLGSAYMYGNLGNVCPAHSELHHSGCSASARFWAGHLMASIIDYCIYRFGLLIYILSCCYLIIINRLSVWIILLSQSQYQQSSPHQ
jgi:hypothetical protein